MIKITITTTSQPSPSHSLRPEPAMGCDAGVESASVTFRIAAAFARVIIK